MKSTVGAEGPGLQLTLPSGAGYRVAAGNGAPVVTG